MAAPAWTLIRLIDKIRDDLDLHSEDFVTKDDIKQMINDAIDDAEQIVVQGFSDHLLTFQDLEVTTGQSIVDVPEDIYESMLRGFFYNADGYTSGTGSGYKLHRIPFSEIGGTSSGEAHRYRLVNTTASGQKFYIYPPAAEDSDDKFRVWYIRQFKRLNLDADILEKGIKPQYVISHTKCAIMVKDGNAMLDVEAQKLLMQEDRLKNAVSRLTDDDEGFLLEPDEYSLDEAYGDDFY